jgi:hypothetical protein
VADDNARRCVGAKNKHLFCNLHCDDQSVLFVDEWVQRVRKAVASSADQASAQCCQQRGGRQRIHIGVNGTIATLDSALCA